MSQVKTRNARGSMGAPSCLTGLHAALAAARSCPGLSPSQTGCTLPCQTCPAQHVLCSVSVQTPVRCSASMLDATLAGANPCWTVQCTLNLTRSVQHACWTVVCNLTACWTVQSTLDTECQYKQDNAHEDHHAGLHAWLQQQTCTLLQHQSHAAIQARPRHN